MVKHDTDELSRFNNVPTANTLIKETQFNSLVYPLPDTPLKKVDDVIYFYKDVAKLNWWKYFDNRC